MAAAPPAAVITQVAVLDTDKTRELWNSVVTTMQYRLGLYYGPPGKGGLSSSGLTYAEIADSRINPEVAYITRTPQTLAQLAEKREGELNQELVGFNHFTAKSVKAARTTANKSRPPSSSLSPHPGRGGAGRIINACKTFTRKSL